jgi:hypothetical protein
LHIYKKTTLPFQSDAGAETRKFKKKTLLALHVTLQLCLSMETVFFKRKR